MRLFVKGKVISWDKNYIVFSSLCLLIDVNDNIFKTKITDVQAAKTRS